MAEGDERGVGRLLAPVQQPVACERLDAICQPLVEANEWLMATAGAALQHVPMPDLGAPGAPGPFAFADPERVRTILDQAGFQSVDIAEVEAPMRLGDNAEDAIAFLARSGMGRALLDKADDDSRARAIAAVIDALRQYEKPEGVYLNGAAWLVTARA